MRAQPTIHHAEPEPNVPSAPAVAALGSGSIFDPDAPAIRPYPPPGSAESSATHLFATEAMACRFELVLRHPDRVMAQSAAEAALDEIQIWHARLNRFDRSSAISHLCAALTTFPPGTSIRTDGETMELLVLCRDAFLATDGAFDVAPVPRSPAGPGGTEFSLLLDPARGLVSLSPDVAHCLDTHPRRLVIDLGGIAKGWAIDRATAILRRAGIDDAFLHGGTSSAAALGLARVSPPVPWSVGIPAEPAPVALQNQAFSMSAHRGGGGSRPDGHIRDSAGQVIPPTASCRHAAWAVCRSAAWAEVLTTAFCAGWDPPSSGRPPPSHAESASERAHSWSGGPKSVDVAAILGDSGCWKRVIPPPMPESFARALA